MLYSLQGGQKEYFNSREKRHFEKPTLAHLINKSARLLCRRHLNFVVICQMYLRHYVTIESNLPQKCRSKKKLTTTDMKYQLHLRPKAFI